MVIQILNILEPWCDRITIDIPQDIIDSYIKLEQPNTNFDLREKINVHEDSDIEISFDANRLIKSTHIPTSKSGQKSSMGTI